MSTATGLLRATIVLVVLTSCAEGKQHVTCPASLGDEVAFLQIGRSAVCGVPMCTYINLDSRTDRRERIEGELNSVQINNCFRMPGVDAKLQQVRGNEACRQSHLAALNASLASQAPYALIMEDDAVFNVGQSTVQDMLCRIKQEIRNYPMFLLSCNGRGNSTDKVWMKLVQDCQTTSAYVIRRDYIPKLMSLWQQDEPEDFLDFTWKLLQKRDGNWAMTDPLLVRQGASYSDIEHKVVDYGVLASLHSPLADGFPSETSV